MNELLSELTPHIVSIVAILVAAVGAYLGRKVGNVLDTREKRSIVSATVQYVEQVGRSLDGAEKLSLAKEKALEWINSKGLSVSDIELTILIEAFVNEFYGNYIEVLPEKLEGTE